MWYTKGGRGLQNDLQAFHFSTPSKMLAMPLNVKITAYQEVTARLQKARRIKITCVQQASRSQQDNREDHSKQGDYSNITATKEKIKAHLKTTTCQKILLRLWPT